jgi:hypothetical protein
MQAFQQEAHRLKLDWVLDQFGSPIPPLHATYWKGVENNASVWPVPGKVSIYLANWDPALRDLGMWQRIIKKYGSKLNVTVMRKTEGYFHDSPPLTHADEAVRLAKYYHDELHLPVTVVVDTAAVQVLPDGRRISGAAPFEEDDYYHWGFILTDRAGKIMLMFPGAPDERELESWIDQALGG